MYYIWSNEHNAWWGKNCRGYTSQIELAGTYTFEQALATCNGANYDWDMDRKNKIPNELPVHVNIAPLLSGKPSEAK
jgi:hypothetical protein